MLHRRSAPILACALFAMLLGVPAPAAAMTVAPPTLEKPAAEGATFREGGSIRFEWRGALQGHPDTLDRSFFRLEIIKASTMPSGAQAAWPGVENFLQTESGALVNEATVGVPDAGDYRWRVCAWGVVNPETANEIQRLDGGCSTSRSFATTVAAAGGGAVTELVVENKVTAPGPVETVVISRKREGSGAAEPVGDAEPTPVTPTPTSTEEPAREAARPVPAIFTALRATPSTGGEATSALDIGSDAGGIGDSEHAADRSAGPGGVRGAIGAGLGGTLPLVPIPFWTLLLLLACIPIARTWRGSVLGMFDWDDGTIDGSGGARDTEADLVPVLVASGLKDSAEITDGDARAPQPDAPAGRRRAA